MTATKKLGNQNQIINKTNTLESKINIDESNGISFFKTLNNSTNPPLKYSKSNMTSQTRNLNTEMQQSFDNF